jgi:hypothetical protein
MVANLGYICELNGAVWTNVGGEETALPLTDLGHPLQQLVES